MKQCFLKFVSGRPVFFDYMCLLIPFGTAYIIGFIAVIDNDSKGRHQKYQKRKKIMVAKRFELLHLTIPEYSHS